MAFREVDVVEIREVLRGWLDGGGLRTIAERAGVDRKTARYADVGITDRLTVEVETFRDLRLRPARLPVREQLQQIHHVETPPARHRSRPGHLTARA